MGGAALLGCPRATTLLVRQCRRIAGIRCCSSLSQDHASFIKDVAMSQPPRHLTHLLRLLKARGTKMKAIKSSFSITLQGGESIVSPGAKQGLLPLAIPLAKNSSGALTALLRWPTAPPSFDMPVVEVRKHGVWLLAKNVDQFIHRLLVEEDSNNSKAKELFSITSDVGDKFYSKGDFAKSNISDLDKYLLREVGLFPDVIERKVMRHFDIEDYVSALVTGEFYTKKEHFPGFARPFVFNAQVLLMVGRDQEAKDAARGALKSPWWTLGCKYEEVARIAQWEDEQIEYIKEKVTEKGKEEALNKGKEPAQIALDEAAYLLDLASIEGTWDEYVDQIADCYKQAGLGEIAKFILWRD